MCASRPTFRSRSGARFARLATLSACCAAAWLAPAQDVVDQAIWTVGTVTRDAGNRDWAYLLWRPTTPELALGRSFAVYSKAGPPAGPGTFQQVAVVKLQTTAAGIQPLLNQATALGDDLTALESQLDALFVTLQPGPTMKLADKLAAVVAGSVAQPDAFQNLLLLGGEHPAVNLAAGLGYAGQIPAAGQVTFEVREYDPAKAVDVAVVGRVILEAGQPVILPPPGPPVQVPEHSAAGDLNIKLRWATPPELRRLSLLQHGYNVYRVPLDLAQGLGWDQSPPQTGALLERVADDPSILRLNRLPVLPPTEFTAQNVQVPPGTNPGLAGPGGEVFFIADDNGRYQPGGSPFVNGAKFLYFVTARDVLGRDGLVSYGGEATACDRLPPNAPQGVRVENDYYEDVQGKPVQSLRVFWQPQPDDGSDTVAAYYVYRWTSAEEAQRHLGQPGFGQIAGPILHVDGRTEMSYLDNGLGAPRAPADLNKTWWYTVRALDAGACDNGNFSPPSAPAFGVLRDRTGPDAPDGSLEILCCAPEVTPRTPVSQSVTEPQNTQRAYLLLTCTRDDPDVLWAQFAYGQAHPDTVLGRVQFAPEFNRVMLLKDLDRKVGAGGELAFFCRAGSRAGVVSDYVPIPVTSLPPVGQRMEIPYAATIHCATRSVPSGPLPSGCLTHQVQAPGQTALQPICLNLLLQPTTREYRIYRRIDGGPLELIEQNLADYRNVQQIKYCDGDLPPVAASVCYFAQLLDEHGNPGPRRRIGACLTLQALQQLPTPILTELAPGDTAGAPTMTVRWFCPPPGVERFELSLAPKNGLMPSPLTAELSPATAAGPRQKTFRLDGQSATRAFQLYRTRLIGPAFGKGARFEVTVPVQAGVDYVAMVAAVGKGGGIGPDSNALRLVWQTPAAPPKVPWPARPLAGTATWDPRLQAEQLPSPVYPGAAIRIGEFAEDTYLAVSADNPAAIPVLKGHLSVEELFYQRNGESLMPFVLYRAQVACAGSDPDYPEGGNLSQVSPLMERVAVEQVTGSQGLETQVVDPYLMITSAYDANRFPNHGLVNIYVRDLHPVIVGACYQYFLVRLQPDGEIREVIPTQVLQIQP